VVAAERRDAHLAHGFEDALLDRGDVVVGDLHRLRLGRDFALPLEFVERFERHVGIDRVGAVAAQQAEVHHLAGLAALDDQAGLVTQTLVEHRMMDRGGRQQRRDRSLGLGDVAIADDDQRGAVADGLLRRGDQLIQTATQGLGRTGRMGFEQSLHRRHAEVVATDGAKRSMSSMSGSGAAA
jgi:N-dimethylarginine dimethylaminohydrolase